VAEGWARGYRNFNVKVAPDPEFDLELCRAVKRLAPEGFLWTDANGGYDEATALGIAPRLAELGVAVLEQPLPANRLSGYRRLKRQGALPILMDEGVISNVELDEFIRAGDARWGGHETGALRRPHRGAASNRTVARPRLMWLGSGLCDPDLSLAASLLLYGAYDLDRPAALNGPQFLGESLLRNPLACTGDVMDVPAGSGLGVEVDEERLRERQGKGCSFP